MSTAVITQPSGPAVGFGLLMSPQTIEQVQSFCLMLSKTEFVPVKFRGKPDSIMVVGAMGARLGVDVFSAMAGIADINGRPSVWGDLLLAVCMSQPQFEDCLESYEGNPYEDNFRAICIAKRKGREPVTRSFSVIEAKESGLWKKEGSWTKTPQRMLQMRARSFALRDTFADALAGFKTVEENEDAVLVDVTASASVHDEPKQGKVRALKSQPETKEKPDVETVVDSKPVYDPAPVESKEAVEKKEEPTKPLTNLEKALAIDPKDVTIDVIWNRCLALTQTKEPKGAGPCLQKIIKENNTKWQIATVSDLGGYPDAQRKEYLVELEQRVVAWSVQFAKGVEL
jgi:hypothetical protein